MINPRDMDKISYNQSESRDTMILYVVTRVFPLMHSIVLRFEAQMQYNPLLG